MSKEEIEFLKQAIILKRLKKANNVVIKSNEKSIVTVKRDQPLPVSWSQQRLWFIAQLDAQASRAYHISASLRLSGTLNLEALERTLNTLLERHEVLRTSFAQNEAGEPIQVIHRDCVFTLTHVDLSGLNKVERNERLAGQYQAEADALFDLETGPLIRGRLLELGANDKDEPEYILLATMHHIVSDGWSMGIFTREISALYEAYLQGQPNPLEPLQIQYADYAHWQRGVLVDDALNQQLNYWQDQLSDAPELLSLPWDRPRPNQQDYRGGSVDIRLNAELTNKLNTLAKAKGMTLYMVLLSAWGVLLSRLSGQDTVVIGTPVANRPRSELEGLIGFFVNTLAIRLDVNATGNVSSYLDDVKGRTLGAYEHQDVPFEQVVEAIQPSRSLSHGPLYQTDFTFENVPEEGELTFSGVGLSDAHVNNEDEMAHSDLSLTLSELSVSSGRIIEGSLGYASALFDASTIARWSEYLLRLLEKIVETPDVKLCDLPMLSSTEREHLLVGVNQSTPLSLPQAHIHSVFEAQAERTPDAIALVQEEESLSYRELNHNANRLAHYLRAQGLQTGALIGVYLPRSLNVFVSMLGIMKAGGAYVVLDPSHPLERIQQICHRADVSIVLSTQSFMPEGIELNSARSIFLDTPSLTDALSSQPKTNLGLTLSADAPAFAYFTSGSTGVPKGALNSHEGAVNAMLAMAKELDLSEQDRVLQFAALGFDVVIEEVLPAWFSGATVVLRDEEGLLSPAQLQQMLERNRITVCELMSSYWSHWVDYLCAQNIVPPDTLRTVLLGSDRVEMNAYSKWQPFNIPIVNVFGLTETGCTSIIYRAEGEQSYTRYLPNGRPLSNTLIYILDDHLNPVPQGVSGELCIGGMSVGLGYVGEPERTSEVFIENPFAKGRLYKTGDQARWLMDGHVEFIGRADHQVKIRGFRIELGEIESQLQKQEHVQGALVMAYGEGNDKQLVVYLTPERDANDTSKNNVEDILDLDVIRSSLRVSLPEYMIPSEMIVLDEFPLTANGKVDRKALPTPDGSGLSRKAYEAPEGELEQSLAAIWQDLLKVERVGRHDNFFDLGGHSLLVMQLMERLRQRGWLMSVQSIFASPILTDLADAITSSHVIRYEAPPNLIGPETEQITPELLPLFGLQGEKSQITADDIEQIVVSVAGGVQNVQDIYPLAPLQEGLLFHHRLADEGLYVTPYLFYVDGQSRRDAFVCAVQSVIDRHDILRTAILWEGLSLPVQVVYRSAPLEMELVTLAADQDEREQLDVLMEQLSMDVERAPLMRLQVAQSQERDGWYVLIQQHHLVTDHVSGDIIQEEILAYLQGEAASLSEPMPYRNFIAHTLTQTNHDDAQAYFTEQLGEIDEISAPFGLLDVYGDGSTVEEASCDVSPDLSRQIRVLSQQWKISPATLFHMVWGLVVSSCSGQHEVVFGTVMLGRLQGVEGADRIIGMFLNMLPLRLTVDPDLSVETYLHETHARVVGLLPYEQYPLVQAQQCSGLPGNTPLFTAILNYRRSTEEEAPNEEREVDLGIEMLGAEERTNYPFNLSVDDLGEGFEVTAQIDRSVSAKKVLGHVIQGLTSLVEALRTSPDLRLSTLSILSDTERDQLLYEFNNTQTDYPQDKCIHELFEVQARLNPDAIALVYEGETLTYQELNKKSNQLATYLITHGVVSDTLVGICVERSLEMVVGLLGILKAGGAYVPLDPNYPKDRLSYMLEDSAVEIVLTQRNLLEQLPITDQQTICLDAKAVYEGQAHTNINMQSLGLKPNHLAYVIYTSGSTGQPKGVMVNQRSVISLTVNNTYVPLSRATVMLQNASVSFDAATFEIWGPLLNGGRLVILNNGHTDIPQLNDFINMHSINTAWMTSGLFDQFASLCEDATLSLTHLLVGGDVVRKRSVSLMQEKNKNVQIINGYGPTENTTFTCCHAIVNTMESLETIPIGKPIGNRQVYVLDKVLSPTAIGVEGELYVGGDGLARGYLNRPELTAEKFIPDPFSKNSKVRLYKTGDLGSWNVDGTLNYLGRNDDQVKIRGFRIELGEIESQLQKQGCVQSALVMAYGEDGHRQLVAYLTPELNSKEPSVDGLEAALDLKLIRSSLKASLPEYMIPSEMIVLDEFPLTPNGKIDRKVLPEPGMSKQKNTYTAPRSKVEKKLCELWEGLLHREQVGITENFFYVGGNSLSAMSLVAAMRKEGLYIELKQLYVAPTIQHLVKLIEQNVVPKMIVQNHLDESTVPLSPWQINFFLKKEKYPNKYFIDNKVDADHMVDSKALSLALSLVLQQHSALRMCFSFVEPFEFCNVIDFESRDDHVTVKDLSGLNTLNQDVFVDEFVDGDEVALDLASGILIRVILFKFGNNKKDQVVVKVHHLVCDKYSLDIIVDDLMFAYKKIKIGELPKLPDLSVSTLDAAKQIEAFTNSQSLRRELSYWTSLPWAEARILKSDHMNVDVSNVTHGQKTIQCELSEDETNLLMLFLDENNTIISDFLIFLAVEAQSQWMGGRCFRVNSVTFGRDYLDDEFYVDLSRSVGWYSMLKFLCFRYRDKGNLSDNLNEITTQIKSMPSKGVGMRFLLNSKDEYIKDKIALIEADWSHEKVMTVHYRGVSHTETPNDHVKDVSEELIEKLNSFNGDKADRDIYRIVLEAETINDKLIVSLNYNENIYTTKSMRGIAGSVNNLLKEIVEPK